MPPARKQGGDGGDAGLPPPRESHVKPFWDAVRTPMWAANLPEPPAAHRVRDRARDVHLVALPVPAAPALQGARVPRVQDCPDPGALQEQGARAVRRAARQAGLEQGVPLPGGGLRLRGGPGRERRAHNNSTTQQLNNSCATSRSRPRRCAGVTGRKRTSPRIARALRALRGHWGYTHATEVRPLGRRAPVVS